MRPSGKPPLTQLALLSRWSRQKILFQSKIASGKYPVIVVVGVFTNWLTFKSKTTEQVT